MEKQKVFIPVDVEKELPPDNNYYHTIDAEGEPNCRTKESFKDFDEISTAFWLKESKGYFFTEEELEKYFKERSQLIAKTRKRSPRQNNEPLSYNGFNEWD
jgi:hypothetical protein